MASLLSGLGDFVYGDVYSLLSILHHLHKNDPLRVQNKLTTSGDKQQYKPSAKPFAKTFLEKKSKDEAFPLLLFPARVTILHTNTQRSNTL
jgi:hypothetical protein